MVTVTLPSGTTTAGYVEQGHLPCDMAVRDVSGDMTLRALFCVIWQQGQLGHSGNPLRCHEHLLWLLNSHLNHNRMER